MLTPEETPSKDRRRQTAIYPSSQKQQKPFSRSAVKRESVMTLPSIEHLQYYFTKTGIAAEKQSLTISSKSLVPAIGTNHQQITPPSPLPELRLPPTPALPSPPPPPFKQIPKTYETNPESLLPDVIQNLSLLDRLWSNTPIDVLELLKSTTQSIRSVRNYLVSLPDDTATRSNFRPISLSSLAAQKSRPNNQPDSLLTQIRRASLDVLASLRQLEESARLPVSDDPFDVSSVPPSIPASRPASSLSAIPHSHNSSSPSRSPLRNHSLTLSPEPSSPSASAPDNSFSFSFVPIQRDGKHHFVPVWDDDPDDGPFAFPDTDDAPFCLPSSASDASSSHGDPVTDNLSTETAASERRARWDARLVLGAGWQYRQDLTQNDILAERAVVARYLDLVDTLLFPTSELTPSTRGWTLRARELERAKLGLASRRRASEVGLGRSRNTDTNNTIRRVASSSSHPADLLPEEHPENDLSDPDSSHSDSFTTAEDDSELPLWAQRITFPNDDLARAHALLTAFLPVHLLPFLPPADPPPTRQDLLHSLASGQLLCVAYNACIRRSTKPWGYISPDAIHDVLGATTTTTTTTTTAAAPNRNSSNSSSNNQTPGGGLASLLVSSLRDSSSSPAPAPTVPEKDPTATENKKAWTFRRTENLRKWAGSLRLRYLLPITTHTPTALALAAAAAAPPISTLAAAINNSSSTSSSSSASALTTTTTTITKHSRASVGGHGSATPPGLFFDPGLVARMDPGWEDMLQSVLLRWVSAVVDERRGEDESSVR